MVSKQIGNKNIKKVLVGLSGGVDSSVSALLLKKQGYQVEGAYMHCWSDGPYCSSEKDQADAAKVASYLNIPFHVFDFEKAYKENVINYFFEEYRKGRTPNPDVMCNREIKFGLFLNKALEMEFDYIATGHYARVSKRSGYRLLKGIDQNKDQSYFLYLVKNRHLQHVLFPLGSLTKRKVREIARKEGLPSAERPDSTGICFIGPADIREFLLQNIAPSHGEIVNQEGKVLGTHIGLAFYTIGQRSGLGFSSPVPYYVADKDLRNNRLIVAPFGDSSLFKSEFEAQEVSWVGKQPPLPGKVEVKLRYRAQSVPATLERAGKLGLKVRLDFPERAITPGQAAVFYNRDELIGGATIEKIH